MNQLRVSNLAESQLRFLGKRLFAFFQVGQLLRNVMSLLCLLSVGLFSFGAAAADADVVSSKNVAPIAINLKQFKVVKDAKGEVQLLDAALVLPGDVIEYRATYANRGTTSLPVVATLPIPESLEYIKDSATAKNNIAHTVALKDSKFSNEPLLHKVATAIGTTLSQPIPYASYRYVRWDLGRLAPGNSIEVSVRAKVAQNPEVDANAGTQAPVLVSSSLQK
jgi:uncharacterized repeat protein (TIGR01451 family)